MNSNVICVMQIISATCVVTSTRTLRSTNIPPLENTWHMIRCWGKLVLSVWNLKCFLLEIRRRNWTLTSWLHFCQTWTYYIILHLLPSFSPFFLLSFPSNIILNLLGAVSFHKDCSSFHQPPFKNWGRYIYHLYLAYPLIMMTWSHWKVKFSHC